MFVQLYRTSNSVKNYTMLRIFDRYQNKICDMDFDSDKSLSKDLQVADKQLRRLKIKRSQKWQKRPSWASLSNGIESGGAEAKVRFI